MSRNLEVQGLHYKRYAKSCNVKLRWHGDKSEYNTARLTLQYAELAQYVVQLLQHIVKLIKQKVKSQ